MTVLAELEPLDPSTGERAMLRVADAADAGAAGWDDEAWWPALLAAPKLSVTLFDAEFDGKAAARADSARLALNVLRNFDQNAGRYVWPGAPVRFLRHAAGDADAVFRGRVTDFSADDSGTLTLNLAVDDEPFAVSVLGSSYSGIGGAEGAADLKGRSKPWLFGRAVNVEPVLIDAVNSVYQVSAYGAVSAVSACYERGASFGAAAGNYATYAALVAAPIQPGQWATCLAQGMVRLGAPATGLITLDADGDTASGFVRKTGEIIARIASARGVTDIAAGTLTALDAAVAHNIALYLTEQVTLLDLAQRLAAPCNAAAGVNLLGELFVARIAFGSGSLTLDAQGRQWPPVPFFGEEPVHTPYKRIMLGAERTWRVHSFDEIAFTAAFFERGMWAADTVYYEGNIVARGDGSRWLFISTTPQAGVTPGTNPVVWSQLSPANALDAKGPYSGSATYEVGDIVLWRIADGGDGDSYIRIGAGDTTGIAPSDGTKWALFIEGGVPGADGADGVDGVDGEDGKLVEFIWKRSLGTPPTPTGNGIPALWSDEPPVGTEPLWMSKAKQELDGTLVAGESWSAPIRHDGPPGADGADGNDGAPGADGIDGTSQYTHTAFADSDDGTLRFTTGSPGGRIYRGEYIDTNPADSEDPEDYVWARYVGPAAFGLANHSNTVIGTDWIEKVAGGYGWNSSGYSTEALLGGCVATVVPSSTSFHWMFGLNQSPLDSTSYEAIDYALYVTGDGTLLAYESGGGHDLGATYAAGDVLQVRYDGASVQYLKNGQVLRVTTVGVPANAAFYLDTSIHSPNCRIEGIKWASVGVQGAGTFTLVSAANVAVGPDFIEKISGGSDWNASAYSSEAFVGGCSASFVVSHQQVMFGINVDPASNTSFDTLDYALYVEGGGSLQRYESGVGVTIGSWSVGDTLQLHYDGKVVRYLNNGVLVHTTTAGVPQGAKFYLDTSIFSQGARIEKIKWTAAGQAGAPGTDGNDGIDGEDGIFREFVWKRANSQPATPTGNGIPSGWSDDPPAGSDPLWMSVAKQELDGSLIDGWSTPIRHDGPPGANGSDGTDGIDGEDGQDAFTIAPSSIAVSIAATNAGTVKLGQLPATFDFTVKRGLADLSTDAATTYSVAITGGVAAMGGTNNRRLSLNSLTADKATGTVTIKVSGVTVGEVPATFTKARDGAAAASARTSELTAPTSGSYGPVGGGPISILTGENGSLMLEVNASFSTTDPAFNVAGKVQTSSSTDGETWSAWSDAAAETSGTATTNGGEPGELSASVNLPLSGAPKYWRARLLLRRIGPGTGTASFFAGTLSESWQP